MPELILSSLNNSELTVVKVSDKESVQEALNAVDWTDLKSIKLVHNDSNSLFCSIHNFHGLLNLILNDKHYKDETSYGRFDIQEAFEFFILEKNRFRLSRPFQLIETDIRKSTHKSDYEESSETDFSPPVFNDEKQNPVKEIADTFREFIPKSSKTKRRNTSKKPTGFPIWLVIALILGLVRYCNRSSNKRIEIPTSVELSEKVRTSVNSMLQMEEKIIVISEISSIKNRENNVGNTYAYHYLNNSENIINGYCFGSSSASAEKGDTCLIKESQIKNSEGKQIIQIVRKLSN